VLEDASEYYRYFLAHLLLTARHFWLTVLEFTVHPNLRGLVVIPLPTGSRTNEDHLLFHEERPVFLGEKDQTVDYGTAETLPSLLLVRSLHNLRQISLVVFNEHAMRVGTIFAVAPAVAVVEIDEFDDVGVVEGGTFVETACAYSHLLLVLVLCEVLIDEFVGYNVAVALGGNLGPVLDEQVGPALAAVPHYYPIYYIYNCTRYYHEHVNGHNEQRYLFIWAYILFAVETT
jgi:hypothetical protein